MKKANEVEKEKQMNEARKTDEVGNKKPNEAN